MAGRQNGDLIRKYWWVLALGAVSVAFGAGQAVHGGAEASSPPPGVDHVSSVAPARQLGAQVARAHNQEKGPYSLEADRQAFCKGVGEAARDNGYSQSDAADAVVGCLEALDPAE